MNLSDLDILARQWDEQRYINREDTAVATDYARERAAREACEAAMGGGVGLVTISEPTPVRYRAVNWYPTGREDEWFPTPTAAYLALYQALKERDD